MKNFLLLITVLFGIHFCSYSQYEYLLELDSFNGQDPKSAYSDITSGSDIYFRHIKGELLTFKSAILYSDYDINTIANSYGYTVKEFKNTTSGSGKNISNETSVLKAGINNSCENATKVCSEETFVGSSSGLGNGVELNSYNRGCGLDNEKQPSWYYIHIGTGGELELVITPDYDEDDFDWALWGPFNETTANDNCAPITSPYRCSASSVARGGQTGIVKYMYNSGTKSFDGSSYYVWSWSKNASGNPMISPGTNHDINSGAPAGQGYGFTNSMNTNTGDVYILMLDNWSATGRPFKVEFGGDAVLSCVDVSLPVELTSFEGSYKTGSNLLSWETETETNNDYFTIEHSTDGSSWYNLDNIQGAGNSTTVNNYSLEHRSFTNTINYYRLTQVDFNGKREVFPVISIDNNQSRKLVKRLNTMGQEVSASYKGIVIEYYDDNSVEKKIY